MKKHIYSVVAFAVFAASAWASPLAGLNVKVPFNFKAGASTLPAGTYRVSEAGAGYVLIRGEKGGIFVPMNVLVFEGGDSGKVSVKFDHEGDSYVLQTIHSEK